MRHHRSLWSALRAVVLAGLPLLLLSGVSGCGGTAKKLHPVEGKVIFKDTKRPLTKGQVVFELVHEDPNQRVAARGNINAQGVFHLTTYEEGDGALEGEHRVMLAPPDDGGVPLARRPPPQFDPRFSVYETSGLRVKVPLDKSPVVLEIEKPRPPQ